MQEHHEVVACYSQTGECGREERPASALEGVDATHFGQMVPSFTDKIVTPLEELCFGLCLTDKLQTSPHSFPLSFLLPSLFLGLKQLFLYVCCSSDAFLMGVVAHACNPSTQMAETRELIVSVSLEYIASSRQARTTPETLSLKKRFSFA